MTKQKQQFIHLIFPIYWILLLLWQLFRPVENRSFLDIGFKTLLFGTMLIYVILKSYFNKINIAGMMLLALYTLLQFISHWNNFDLFKVSYLIDIVFSFCMIFTFLILNSSNVITRDELIIFSKIITGVVLVLCIYADVFQFQKLLAAIKSADGYSNAISSLLASNHEFGLYLSFGIVSVTFLLANCKGVVWQKIMYSFFIALFFFNLIFTFSRTSLISVLIAGAIAVNTMKKYRLAFISIVLLFAGIILMSQDLRDFILYAVLRVHHDGNRSILLKGGIEYFLKGSIKDKLIGVGPSQTLRYVREISSSINFHNGYITILISGGLSMMMFFLYIVIDGFCRGFKVLRYNKYDGAYMLAASTIMLLYMWGQTPIIFTSDLISSMLTFYCVIIPKYYFNYHKFSSQNSANV